VILGLRFAILTFCNGGPAVRHSQKLLVSAIVALSTITGAVATLAADLPERPYTQTPVMAVVYNWTGVYLGGNGGYGTNHNCWSLLVVDGCHNSSGGLAGGQLGFRQQAGAFVFGAELQGDWASLRGSHVSLVNPSFTDRSKVDGLLLITGQVGYAWNAALVYLKGGLAVIDSRFDVLTNPGGVSVAATTDTRWGSVVGVGFEYGFAPNWSAGVEYDHLFVGSSTNSFTTPAGLAFATARISQNVDMFTVRVNYRIGGWL
jgi:outer membrane immunogenic protein